MRLPQVFKRWPILEIISVVVAIGIWEAVYLLSPSLQKTLPDPPSVLKAFIELNTVGDTNGNVLLLHSLASLTRLLIGFCIAVITALPLGLLMSVRNVFYRFFKPLVEIVRPIPPIAWIPVAILLLSITYGSLFIIWLGAFFPILLNTLSGVKRTSSVLMDVAKTFGANEKTVVYKVVIPSALPEIFTGLRIGLGVGWMCILAAEMFGADFLLGGPLGLGYLVYTYGFSGLMPPTVAVMITIGLVAFVMNEVFLRVESRLFKWRVEIAK